MRHATALVTGATSGLGLATAKALVARGYTLIGVDRDAPAPSEGAAEDGIIQVAADVTDEDQMAAAVGVATDRGPLRLTVCCAGISASGRILGRSGPHPLERFRAAVEVNLVGTFNTMRLAAEAMAQNPVEDDERGAIVLTSSVTAYDGQVGQIAYAASKAGVAGMTLPAARDLGRTRIRVVAIAPGTFETPMLAGLTPQAREALAAQIPHPSRPGVPEEFAALVCHIAENRMLNGEVIRLDGALRMPYLP
ncbi:SDR family NAD(P)-dependent oxidoreductase [Intrasporangium sp. DVR]|uniref:SDR family NAD(P)-dependent oxidoreductase n=1 Tax=Intrasporangium sp. DVR TaxID=3127867 RepID=UPI00313A68EA